MKNTNSNKSSDVSTKQTKDLSSDAARKQAQSSDKSNKSQDMASKKIR